MAEEIVLSLDEALAPYLAAALGRRLLEGLAELIAVDAPPAELGRRLAGLWCEHIEDVPPPSTAVAFWGGPVQLAVAEHDRAFGGVS